MRFCHSICYVLCELHIWNSAMTSISPYVFPTLPTYLPTPREGMRHLHYNLELPTVCMYLPSTYLHYLLPAVDALLSPLAIHSALLLQSIYLIKLRIS